MKRFFVTGTDTGIGKTYISCVLMRQLVQQQYRVIGLKPLGLGVEDDAAAFQHEDAIALMQASNIEAPYEDINPFLYPPFSAPHIALEQVNSQLSAVDIVSKMNQIIDKYQADFTLIEGAGGFAVPLTRQDSMIDLAKGLAQDVILVVGLRLGCLNHTLLTYQAIEAAGLNCACWVANEIDPEMEYQQENISLLKEKLPARYLGCVKYNAKSPAESSLLEHSLIL